MYIFGAELSGFIDDAQLSSPLSWIPRAPRHLPPPANMDKMRAMMDDA